jgi:RecG-like helicase
MARYFPSLSRPVRRSASPCRAARWSRPTRCWSSVADAGEDGIDAPPAIRSRLRKLGLTRRDDLVLHLPLRYEDETRLTPIARPLPGVPVQVDAEVLDVSVKPAPRRQLVATVAMAAATTDAALPQFLRQPAPGARRARRRPRLRIFGEIRHGFLGRRWCIRATASSPPTRRCRNR